jgi:ribonuclease T2
MGMKQCHRTVRQRRPGRLPAALLAILLFAAPSAARTRHRSGHSEAGAFDYYLLSLSIAPSFCALSPANNARAECRNLSGADYRQMPLTVHGLWPNRAFVSVNQQPQHCPGPPLGTLPDDLQAQLGRVMPGGPGLEQHEWSTHGTCSGLSPQNYFEALVRLAHSADGTIGTVLRERGLLGQEVRITDLLAGIAGQDPALARATVVSCRFPRGGAQGGRALIEEIRIVLSRDLAPRPAADVGLGQNSGCPGGHGFLPG